MNYVYGLDGITMQKIQVNSFSIKRKNICRRTNFDRPDTLASFRF